MTGIAEDIFDFSEPIFTNLTLNHLGFASIANYG